MYCALCTAELDAGQALTQGVLTVDLHDNVQSLAARVHVLEHLIYPQAVEWICNGTIQHLENGQVLYKGQALKQPIQFCQL